jgi:hypothetical protein
MIEINGELVVPPGDDQDETMDDGSELVSNDDYELGSIRFDGEVRVQT